MKPNIDSVSHKAIMWYNSLSPNQWQPARMIISDHPTSHTSSEDNNMKLIQDLGMIYATQKSTRKRKYGIYSCHCGKEFRADTYKINNGLIKSCGCMKAKLISDARKTHGLWGTRLYVIYRNMLDRCYRSANKAYARYGGAGVTVCEEWRNDFMSFYNWAIKNGYDESKVLDKDIKSDGMIYSPSACIWTTYLENSQSCNQHKRKVANVHFHKLTGKYFGLKSVLGKTYRTSLYKTEEDAKLALTVLLGNRYEKK